MIIVLANAFIGHIIYIINNNICVHCKIYQIKLYIKKYIFVIYPYSSKSKFKEIKTVISYYLLSLIKKSEQIFFFGGIKVSIYVFLMCCIEPHS